VSATELERVIQAHNAIKNARASARRAYEAQDADMEEDQKKLKAWLLGQLNVTGAKSIVTALGTVFRREVMKPSAADWGAIWAWMKEHDAPDLVERRLKVTFIKEYMAANAGALPPGINIHREFEVSVRQPGQATDTANRYGGTFDADPS